MMLRANAESGAAKTFASANRSSYQPVVVMNYTSPTTMPPEFNILGIGLLI